MFKHFKIMLTNGSFDNSFYNAIECMANLNNISALSLFKMYN